ncbi:hypothetical protein SeMB42_g07226 [Synchytrium endobioticum]|uniref:Csf1 N-terminal domain-containing protein n=1 Tax=Synchytrium endobioticum TaxID=286115 RepID=A0A507C742_9FUNG|nr:hypothetical protein SeMB42_g07226 [Synchytrium endobioticum]
MNRAIALLFTCIVNFYTWRTNNQWIELESIALAPLSGKIMFKNFKFYSRDQSICILRGHVTFRYWVFRVRTEPRNPDEILASADLPCRLKIRIDGLEWFMYNRTAAYEHLKVLFETIGLTTDPLACHSPDHNTPPKDTTAPVQILPNTADLPHNSAKDAILRALLPLELVSSRGAVMIGNPDLPNILTISYHDAKGTYEIAKPRSPHDLYSSNITVKYNQAKFKMQLNSDYKEPILNQASRMRDSIPENKLFKGIPLLEPLAAYISTRRQVPQHHQYDNNAVPLQSVASWRHWAGLSRYTNASSSQIHSGVISPEEYARVLRILDCDELTMNYYYDNPGLVPAKSVRTMAGNDIGNGDLPPQWGLDLLVNNASIFYGPWTDRQRHQLQQYFYPPSYTSQRPSQHLGPDHIRVHTAFKILIQFSGNCSWQIPLREASKDHLFTDWLRGASEGLNARKKRHYGWFDVKFTTGSIISYTMPLFTSENGCSTEVSVNLKDIVVASSSNHAEMLVSDRLVVSCSMHHPLVWNAFRQWKFDIVVVNLSLDSLRSDGVRFSTSEQSSSFKGVYLLRDHVTLLQDLITDWGSGPPTTLEKHVPIHYQMKIAFSNFRFLLCVNPFNVINQSNDLEDNAYFIIQGNELKASVMFDFTLFNSEAIAIPCDIEMKKLTLSMSLPPTNTIGAFLTEEASKFSHIENTNIALTYRYHRDPDTLKPDSLTMVMSANNVNTTLFGFHIRYILSLRDNYFGQHTNFKTVTEYNWSFKDSQQRLPVRSRIRPFEIHCQVFVNDAIVFRPETLYAVEMGTVMRFRESQLEFRSTPHYSDLQLTLSPIIITRAFGNSNGSYEEVGNADPTMNNFLHLQDIQIRCHSLVGPPPTSSIYLTDWRINIGAVSGELQPSFIPAVFTAMSTFFFHLEDVENSNPTPASLPDVGLFEINLSTVDLRMWGQDSTMRFLMNGGRLLQDNMATDSFISQVLIELPEIATRVHVVTDDGSVEDREWVEVLEIDTAASIGIFNSIPRGSAYRQLQQQFLKFQDEATERLSFLYNYQEGYGSKKSGSYVGMFYPEYHVPLSFTNDGKRVATLSLDSGSAVIQRNDENGSYHTASDASSDKEFPSQQPEAEPVLAAESVWLNEEEPVTPRSIPYRDYLRRWRMVKPAEHLLAPSLQAYISPTLTQFEPLNFQSERLFERFAAMRNNQKLPPAFKILASNNKGGQHGLADSLDEDTCHQAVTVDVPEKLSVLLTPMFLKLVEEVLVETTSKDIILDSLLDRFQLAYMSWVTKSFQYDYDSFAILVGVPKVDLLCIQDMQLPESTTFLNDDRNINLRTRYELSDAVLCSFDISLDDSLIQVYLKHENPSAMNNLRLPSLVELKLLTQCAAFHFVLRFMGTMNAVGIIGVPAEKRSARRASVVGDHSHGLEAAPVVLDIHSDQVAWTAVVSQKKDTGTRGSSVNFEMRSLNITTINQTVEIMFGSLTTWLNFVVDISTLLTEFSNKRRRQIQLLVARILELSKLRPPGDPKFLTNRSVLWNLVSRPFQSTSSWKILAHIRYCLSNLSPDIASTPNILLADNEATPKQLFDSVVAHLSDWRQAEIGEFELRRSPLLLELYGVGHDDARTDTPLNLGVYNTHTALKCERFSLVIVEQHATENTVEMRSVHVTLKTRLNELASLPAAKIGEDSPWITPHEMHNKSSAVLSILHQYLDVAGHASIDSLRIEINPNMFGFIRHALRVYSWFVQRKLVPEAIPGLPPLPVTPSTRRRSSVAFKRTEFPSKPLSAFDWDDVFPAGLLAVLTVTGSVSIVQLVAKAHLLEMKVHIMGIQPSTIHRLRLRSASTAAATRKNRCDLVIDDVVRRHVFEDLVHSTIGRVDYIVLRVSERAHPLLTFDIRKVSTTVTMSRESHTMPVGGLPPKALKIGCLVGSVAFTLPRSLLKLHAFLEKWGDEDLPKYDFLFNKMIEELSPVSHHPQSQAYEVVEGIFEQAASRIVVVDLQVGIDRVDFQCDLLSSLRLNYIGTKWLLVLNRQEKYERQERHISMNYVLRLGKQDIAFETSTIDEEQITYSKPIFTVPAITSRGAMTFAIVNDDDASVFKAGPTGRRFSVLMDLAENRPNVDKSYSYNKVIKPRLETSISMETISATVNVNMIDQFTTAQSVFGHELNDLIEVIMFYRRERDTSVTRNLNSFETAADEPSFESAMSFDIDTTILGVSVAAESPDVVMVFDSQALNGIFRNTETPESSLNWNLRATSVKFSLCHRFSEPRGKLSPMLAFFEMVDLKVQSLPKMIDSAFPSEIVISSRSIRSYLPPVALAKTIDFCWYYHAELARKDAIKTDELKSWRAHTKLLLESINVPVPEYTEAAKSYITHRQITLDLANIGFALPLVGDSMAVLDANGSRQSEADVIPTLLWSITRIQVRLHEFRKSASVIENCCLQFVPSLIKTDAKQYSSRFHPLQNRLLLKKMEARVHRVEDHYGNSHHVVNGDVSGFEFELDAAIADYINRLLAVYESSRGNVLRVVNASQVTAPSVESDTANMSRAMVLDVEAHFKFESERPTKRTVTFSEKDTGLDDFIIPGVTVGVRGTDDSVSPGGLHLEIRIHPSQNSISPNILDFARDVMDQTRIGRLTRMSSMPDSSQQSYYARGEPSSNRALSAAAPRYSVTLHLVLSETVVNLTCEPNVVCALTVQEVNFLVSYIPPRQLHNVYRFMCCHGFLLGIAGGLRNKYSPEDCIKIELKQLKFGATMIEESHNRTYVIEGDLPYLRMDLNVRHLQDLFLFDRTWFGRCSTPSYPSTPAGSVYTAAILHPSKSDDGTPMSQRPSRSLLQLARLAATKKVNYRDSARIVGKVGKIEMVADLGQAIGRATITLDNLLGNTSGVWTSNIFESRSLMMGFRELSLIAQGRTSGSLLVNDVRVFGWGTNPWDAEPDPQTDKRRATDLNVKIERIVSQLEYQHERILILEVLPISGTIVDEWLLIPGGKQQPPTSINMHFKVDQVRAIVSRRTLPVFGQNYRKLLSLIHDKRSTDRRHKVVAPSPSVADYPTTGILMLDGLPALSVASLNIVVGDAFLTMTRYNFRDPDCALVLASMVKIGYMHAPNADFCVRNQTLVEVSSFAIRKCTAKAITPNLERTLALKEWFTFYTSSGAKNVVRVPATTMDLIVDGSPLSGKFGYSFKTDFSGQIDVALNFGLYRYLQELAGLYSRTSQASTDGGTEFDHDDTDSTSILSNGSTVAEGRGLSPILRTTSSAASSDDGKLPSRGGSWAGSIGGGNGSSGSSAGRRDTVEFVQTGDFKFEPQLKVTGDATPWEWIEWLGVHKDEMPKLIHKGLGQPLNSGLLLLCNLYGRIHVLPIEREAEPDEEFLDAEDGSL